MRLPAAALVVLILPVAVSAVKPATLEKVEVDLEGSALKSTLPRDVPFLLTGIVPVGVTIVEVREIRTEGIAPPVTPSAWVRQMEPKKDARFDTFVVHMPRLAAQQDYRLRVLAYRPLSDKEKKGIAEVLLESLAEKRSDVLVREAVHAKIVGLGNGAAIASDGGPVPYLLTAVPSIASLRVDDSVILAKMCKIVTDTRFPAPIVPGSTNYTNYMNPGGNAYFLGLGAGKAQARALLRTWIDAVTKQSTLGWVTTAKLKERAASLQAVLAILENQSDYAIDRSRGGKKSLADLYGSEELTAVIDDYGKTIQVLVDWSALLLALEPLPGSYTSLGLAAKDIKELIKASNEALTKTRLLQAAAVERRDLARKREAAAAAWVAKVTAKLHIATERWIHGDTHRDTHVGAEVGYLVAFGRAAPYGGISFSFWPVTKDVPLSQQSGCCRRRLTMTLGLTATSIEDKERGRFGVHSDRAGVLGAGWRITQSVKVGTGAMVLRRRDPESLLSRRRTLAVAPYASMSIDQPLEDLAKKLSDILTKLLPGF